MKKEISRCATCGKKTRKPVTACSECSAIEAADMKRGKRVSKLYFWLFVTLAIMAVFLIWSSRGETFFNEKAGINTGYIAAIISLMLSLMFGLFCFVRFIRNRSIAGGLFLTVAISTAIFLGTSQVVDAIIPQTAAAMTGGVNATNASYSAIVGLAQVGLFTLWFLFLLLAIYTQISPVKKIDKVLTKIIDGEGVKHVSIGKSRQYRTISEKLESIASEVRKRSEQDQLRREKQLAQRARAAERKAKHLEIQKQNDERLA